VRTIGSHEHAGSLSSIRRTGTRVDVGCRRGLLEQPGVEPVASYHQTMFRRKIGVDRHTGGLKPQPPYTRRVRHTDDLAERRHSVGE
jgi:hypothetical protein